MDYISEADLYELMKENKSGHFHLTDAITGYNLCFYPQNIDNEDLDNKKASKTETNDLISKLQSVLSRTGAGKYKIRLRTILTLYTT